MKMKQGSPASHKRAAAASKSAIMAELEQNREQHLRLALRLLGNLADAEDAIQDASVSVMLALDRFRGESSASTWIFRIMYNSCLLRIRRLRRMESLRASGSYSAFCDQSTPVDVLVKAEMRSQCRSCFQQLAPSDQAVLRSRDVLGLSTRGTARTFDVSAGAVKVRLHRARGRMREVLHDHTRLLREDA